MTLNMSFVICIYMFLFFVLIVFVFCLYMYVCSRKRKIKKTTTVSLSHRTFLSDLNFSEILILVLWHAATIVLSEITILYCIICTINDSFGTQIPLLHRLASFRKKGHFSLSSPTQISLHMNATQGVAKWAELTHRYTRYTKYTKSCKVGGALKDAGSWLPLGVIKLTIFVCHNWLQ